MSGLDQAPLPGWALSAVQESLESGPDIDVALSIARAVGQNLPPAGVGNTRLRWAVLAAIARANVTVARVVEAHTDALTIRAEAGINEIDSRTWGVFAAESPTARLEATPGVDAAAEAEVTLTGHKPWCSLGAVLDAALVTAWNGAERQLFEIDLHHPGVTARPATGWVSRGLPTVASVGLDLEQVPARPVGAPGWYLQRPGFAWGGIGVAACWLGAARGVADVMTRARPGDIGSLHAGRIDLALYAADCVLTAAAAEIDAGAADTDAGEVLALRARSIVVDACETVLREVAHATGPAPLAFDEAHAARVADLEIYIRQHHGERDVAALGDAIGKSA